jgi:hypothetical protein
MKEKEKGKVNPFVGVLRDDEDILWLYKRPPLTFGGHLKQYALTSVAGLLVVSVLFGLFLFLVMLINGSDAPWTAVLAFSVLAASGIVGVLLSPLLVIGYPFDWWQEQCAQRAYAVTNQRLLTYTNGHFSEVGIETISTLNSSKETILFGQSFARWRCVEDAADVVQLIHQVRDERLKTLQEKANA